VKRDFRRFIVVLALVAVPFVYAQPVSFSQDIAISPETFFSGLSASVERFPGVASEPVFYGTASWYSRSDRGVKKRTASGAIFDHSKKTCAAWGLPFGTRVRVTNLANGRSVICTVNDRGPSKKLKRLVDLTKSAFKEIANPKHGLIQVRVVPLGPAPKHAA
jgi:rare lipoprotein A (peptidoglycan hydrolase)